MSHAASQAGLAGIADNFLSRPVPLPWTGSSRSYADILWIAFIVGAGSAARPLGIHNVERYVWALADLAVVAWIVRDYRPFLTTALQNKLLMSWPLLACLSALWSYNPGVSLYHGLQLLMTTLVAFQFCLTVDRSRIPKLVFLGVLVCLVSSLAFKVLNPGQAVDINGAFRGVFSHKNELGSMMTLLVFTSATLFLARWRPLLTLAAGAAAILVLVMSKSGTALIACALVLMLISLAFCLRRGSRVLGVVIGVGCLLAAGLLLAVQLQLFDPFKTVLSSVGKETTLTGRTILWAFGWDAFTTHPWLGWGYKGYWESTQSTVFYLRYVIGQDLWFFHNNLLEVAVAFGIMGPILFIAALVNAFRMTLRVFTRDLSYISLWYLLFVVFISIASMAEYPLFLNHSLWQFLFVAVYVSTARAIGARRAQPRSARSG